MGVLATMVLGGSDFAGLVQASAFVALALGVIGSARAIGLGRSEALLGGLLVATLPVIALQASAAQNDLIVASFLVAAVVLLLDRGPALPWLAGAATALAVGTKVTAVIGILCWPWSRSSCHPYAAASACNGAGGRGGRWILVRRQLVAGGKLGTRASRTSPSSRGSRRPSPAGCDRPHSSWSSRRGRSRPLALRRHRRATARRPSWRSCYGVGVAVPRSRSVRSQR